MGAGETRAAGNGASTRRPPTHAADRHPFSATLARQGASHRRRQPGHEYAVRQRGQTSHNKRTLQANPNALAAAAARPTRLLVGTPAATPPHPAPSPHAGVSRGKPKRASDSALAQASPLRRLAAAPPAVRGGALYRG